VRRTLRVVPSTQSVAPHLLSFALACTGGTHLLIAADASLRVLHLLREHLECDELALVKLHARLLAHAAEGVSTSCGDSKACRGHSNTLEVATRGVCVASLLAVLGSFGMRLTHRHEEDASRRFAPGAKPLRSSSLIDGILSTGDVDGIGGVDCAALFVTAIHSCCRALLRVGRHQVRVRLVCECVCVFVVPVCLVLVCGRGECVWLCVSPSSSSPTPDS